MRRRWPWALLSCLAGLLTGCDRYRDLGEIEIVFRGAEGAMLMIRTLAGEAIELQFRFEATHSSDFRTSMGGSAPDASSWYEMECPGLSPVDCFLALGFYGLDRPLAGRREYTAPIWGGKFPIGDSLTVVFRHKPLLERFLFASDWQILEHSLAVTDGELSITSAEGMALVGRLRGKLKLYSTFSL